MKHFILLIILQLVHLLVNCRNLRYDPYDEPDSSEEDFNDRDRTLGFAKKPNSNSTKGRTIIKRPFSPTPDPHWKQDSDFVKRQQLIAHDDIEPSDFDIYRDYDNEFAKTGLINKNFEKKKHTFDEIERQMQKNHSLTHTQGKSGPTTPRAETIDDVDTSFIHKNKTEEVDNVEFTKGIL